MVSRGQQCLHPECPQAAPPCLPAPPACLHPRTSRAMANAGQVPEPLGVPECHQLWESPFTRLSAKVLLAQA